MPKRGVTVSCVNSQRHIAVPRSLGTVLDYDQTDPAYLEGFGFQDHSFSPDPPGIRKPSVHLRWKWFLSLFRTVALPFPLVTTPSGLLFSAKLASPNGLPNTAQAIYEDFCRQPSHLSMILVENGYSIKNHGKLSGMPFCGTGFFRHRKAKTRRRRYAEK